MCTHTPVAIPLPTPPPVTVVVAGPAQHGADKLSLQQTMDKQGIADRSHRIADIGAAARSHKPCSNKNFVPVPAVNTARCAITDLRRMLCAALRH
jgi:hypothetical protein